MSGATMDYVTMDRDGLGVEYTGKKELLEYMVGDMTMKSLNESGRKYAGIKVGLDLILIILDSKNQLIFQVTLALTRKWFYHGISVFLQSFLLLVVAYMTFYFRIDNFQVI